MHLLTVIPARLGSSRLPCKPLRLLAGEPLIRAVVRNALGMRLPGRLVVATDDRRVADAVAPLGVPAVLTDPAHGSGTERVAEVAALSRYRGSDIVVNLQGDEPFLPRAAVDAALAHVQRGDDIGTAAQPPGERDDPNRVKVAVDGHGRALGFFRRGGQGTIFQHIGIYAFTPAKLNHWVRLPAVPDEARHGLEQLRPLGHGMTIGVGVLTAPVPHGIDTEEDLRMAEALL